MDYQNTESFAKNPIKRKNNKKIKKWIHLSLKIILIIIATLFALPYIYTSPTINTKNLSVYNRFIEFTKQHKEHNVFQLDAFGWIHIGEDFFILDNPDDMEKLKYLFPKSELNEIRRICKELHSINCNTAIRENDMVIFVKNIFPIYPKCYGALYSLSGQNPNEINSELLNKNKPFVKIEGNWYTSNNLAKEVRFLIPVPIPQKSLIDRSLSKKEFVNTP